MARRLLLLVALVACKREAAPLDGPVIAAKANYEVRLVAGVCRVGACEVRLVLRALGDYHVNEDYPVKLVATGADAGTFTRADAKTGTLVVALHPTAVGTLHVAGTFKLCVCTEENCDIDTPQVAFDVAVGG
jgi:hypothetical protein